MPERKPSLEEQRLQVLEVFSEKISRLERAFDEFKKDHEKETEKIEQIRITLSNMQGADLNEKVRENKGIIDKQEERIRELENFKNNLTGRLAILAFLGSVIAGIVATILIKVIEK